MMYFRWEPSSIGMCQAVYYDEKPKSMEGATKAVEVPEDCIGSDGAPMFGRLKQRFPKPVDEALRDE